MTSVPICNGADTRHMVVIDPWLKTYYFGMVSRDRDVDGFRRADGQLPG